ncbi:MAG: hypothetical protein ABJB66_12555 [Gemmatimonadaceae bacterium]
MSFQPVSIANWPDDRAVLFVHGIGNASEGGISSFPLDEFKTALGADAKRFAIYTLNYDFINDWLASKTELAATLKVLKKAIAKNFGGDDLANTIAEYAGDIFWPVLSADIRLAVRDAFVAQAEQIQIDRAEAALSNGDDPREYQVSIIAHSLGCFHTYEMLVATARDPHYHLQPFTDHARWQSVFLMASPVQIIRTIGNDITLTVPQLDTLGALSKNALRIPAEVSDDGTETPCARQFVSIAGTMDPVGGYLLGKQQKWAYMSLGLPNADAVIDPETFVGTDPAASLKETLITSARAAMSGGVSVNDPHSWSQYIVRNASKLREALLTRLPL